MATRGLVFSFLLHGIAAFIFFVLPHSYLPVSEERVFELTYLPPSSQIDEGEGSALAPPQPLTPEDLVAQESPEQLAYLPSEPLEPKAALATSDEEVVPLDQVEPLPEKPIEPHAAEPEIVEPLLDTVEEPPLPEAAESVEVRPVEAETPEPAATDPLPVPEVIAADEPLPAPSEAPVEPEVEDSPVPLPQEPQQLAEALEPEPLSTEQPPGPETPPEIPPETPLETPLETLAEAPPSEPQEIAEAPPPDSPPEPADRADALSEEPPPLAKLAEPPSPPALDLPPAPAAQDVALPTEPRQLGDLVETPSPPPLDLEPELVRRASPPTKPDREVVLPEIPQPEISQQVAQEEQPPAPQPIPEVAAAARQAPSPGPSRNSELDLVRAIQAQVAPCWRRSSEQAAGVSSVVVLVTLNRNGTIRKTLLKDRRRAETDQTYRALARGAEAAFLRCGPYRLPGDQYALWRELEVDFHAN
ncbi:MAG: hypothetical protein RIC87_09755 [Kiloniellales bacterium]